MKKQPGTLSINLGFNGFSIGCLSDKGGKQMNNTSPINQLILMAWYEFLANETPDIKETLEWLTDNTCYLDLWAKENGYKEIEETGKVECKIID